jgi:molybdate transport system ATP-binding protein
MTALAFGGTACAGPFRVTAEFEARAGEVVGVLGPNGAGKTTLLRAIAGLAELSDGQVLVGATTWVDVRRGVFVAAERRAVGYVFQNYRLFPHLSVRDNVGFALRARGATRRESREAADEWLARLDIAELAGRRPRQLSGGQAQRVALARALAARPDVLLLDEPLAALDARTRAEVRAGLRRHLAGFGGPALVVTHDPLEAMVLADRLVVLEDGAVVQRGTPAEISRRPATQYVAQLVGLNLYAGTVRGDAIDLDGGGAIVAADPGPVGARVLAAVRPSAISLHSDRPDHSSPRNVWHGTVEALELLTDRVRVQVSGRPSALVDVTPGAIAALRVTEGRPIWLSAKATEVEVYPDPASPSAPR